MKMKLLLASLITCSLLFTGCGSTGQANSETYGTAENDSDTASGTEAYIDNRTEAGSDTEAETEAYEAAGLETEDPEEGEKDADVYALYQEVLDVTAGAVGASDSYADDKGISHVYSLIPSEEYLGYHLIDLDEDGVEELLIGDCGYEKPSIYDIYCIYDGELCHIFQGEERNYMVLCEDNTLYHFSSSGAEDSTIETVTFFDGILSGSTSYTTFTEAMRLKEASYEMTNITVPVE